jgi:septum formation protein
VLASRSPRRAALLRAAGLTFEVRPSDADETRFAGQKPIAAAAALCRVKAERIAPQCAPGTLVLSADTMVVLGDRVFNKPGDRADAASMLRELAGRTHSVITGLCLMRVGGQAVLDAASARVRFNPADERLIREYVDSGEADDKAGAYGIQGLGWRLVAAVDGDLTTVIGLPLVRLRQMATELLGADPFAGRSLRAIALAAFPDLVRLPPHCLGGIPD